MRVPARMLENALAFVRECTFILFFIYNIADQHHDEDELRTSMACMNDQLHMTTPMPPPPLPTHLPLDNSDTAIFPVTGTTAICMAGVM